MRALITEHGSNRGALAAARALAGAGWTVDVASSTPSVTSHSRCVRSCHAVTSPHLDVDAFVGDTARVVESTGAEVVFPVDETHLLALSAQRSRLGAVLPYASDDVVRAATDRLHLARVAERTGLGTPKTWNGTIHELEDWRGPVVVKGRHPALIGSDDAAARVETRIGMAEDAREWIDELQAAGVDVVVQQLTLGRLSSAAVLTDAASDVIAESHQRTERMWPPEAGVSTRAETVPADPELSAAIRAFLKELGWIGLVQLQFIVDSAGRAHLIDFNPRFYGSLSLAIAAGTNFPALWAALATSRPLPPVTPPQVGLRYHWLGGDLRRAVRERRPGLARDVAGSLRWTLPAVHPIWSVRDPLPAAFSVAAFLRGRVQRRDAAPPPAEPPPPAEDPATARFTATGGTTTARR